MTKKEKIQKLEAAWKEEKQLLETKQKIKAEKKSIKEKAKISTSKLIMLFLFINCTIVEIFTGYVTLKSFALAMLLGFAIDFSPLIALISAVVGEVIGFAIYAIKATKENCSNGITYELAMRNYDEQENDIKG